MYILDVRATIDSSGIPETILMNKNPKHNWMFGQLGVTTNGLLVAVNNMATSVYMYRNPASNKEDAKCTEYL